MDAMREKLISLLPPERRAHVVRDIEALSKLNLVDMTDAALAELYDAVSGEIARRDQMAG